MARRTRSGKVRRREREKVEGGGVVVGGGGSVMVSVRRLSAAVGEVVEAVVVIAMVRDMCARCVGEHCGYSRIRGQCCAARPTAERGDEAL